MSKLTVEQVEEWPEQLIRSVLTLVHPECRESAEKDIRLAIRLASVRDAEPVAWMKLVPWGQSMESQYCDPGELKDKTGWTPLYLHPTAQPSADELKGWAVFGPDGDCDHVVAGESEQFAWESFSQNSNWRTKNVPPEHWKEKGYTCVEVRITRLARSAT